MIDRILKLVFNASGLQLRFNFCLLREFAKETEQVAFDRYSLLSDDNSAAIAPVPANDKRKRLSDLTNAVKQDELSRYLCEPICNENDNPSEYWRNNNIRFHIVTKMLCSLLLKMLKAIFPKQGKRFPSKRDLRKLPL